MSAFNQFLHSFPDGSSAANNFDGANFSVYLNMNVNAKVDKFTLYDDITNYHAIPKARFVQKVKKRFKNPATDQWVETLEDYYFYAVPRIRNNVEARDCARFKFQVHNENNVGSNPRIARPEGKKAYLSNIAFQVFDGHEPFIHRKALPDGVNNPSLKIIPLDINNNEISVETIRKTGIFGNQSEVGIVLFAYQTKQPIYANEYEYVWKMFEEGMHNYQGRGIHTLTYEGIHSNICMTEKTGANYKYSVEDFANHLRGTAPRGAWHGGIISDWLRNNYELTLIGKNGNTFVKILWDSKGRSQLNEINQTSSYETQSDEPLNQMLNNIDLEIPSNVDNIEVVGIRPYYYTEIVTDNEDIKLRNSTGVQTIVTFPIKIQIGVTYK